MSKLKLQGMQPLFYSPLTVFELQESEALNNLLLNEIALRQSNSPGLDRSNWRGWHSEDDFFLRTEPGCQSLRTHIFEALENCTRTLSPDFDFTRYGVQAEGWINVLGHGGLNTPHDHPGWVWSGCYYVSIPDADQDLSGNIEFFDTRTNVRTLTVEGAACFASKFVMKPQTGMLLLFPSYLRHWVYPNESRENRISIAFNARFAKMPKS
jgi:uncharacterized protein (TIGR02466 family)